VCKQASKIIGINLTNVDDLYVKNVIAKINKILTDCNNSLSNEYIFMKSQKRLKDK
jgi:hypothetical protein